jgi:hypothetical protein
MGRLTAIVVAGLCWAMSFGGCGGYYEAAASAEIQNAKVFTGRKYCAG